MTEHPPVERAPLRRISVTTRLCGIALAHTVHACALLASCASIAAADSSDAALVYARDPEQSPRPELAALPLKPDDASDGLQQAWLRARSCVERGALTSARLRVCSPVASAHRDAQGRFSSAPAPSDAPASEPDAFAEQMLFYHGARALQFFAGLGMPPARSAAPLTLIANVRLPSAGGALEPWRDAAFVRKVDATSALTAPDDTHGPTIYFGQDHALRVAYDSGAIRHEVAHAVLSAWLSPREWLIDRQGTSTAPAAIAEALADYFAAAMVDDPRLGVHAADARNPWQVRNLSTSLRCPAALSGMAHEDGLMIASALWAARKQLGSVVDEAILTALETHPIAALTTERLLQRVTAALAARQPSAASPASEIFHARGLAPSCERVLDVTPEQSLTGSYLLPGAAAALPLASAIVQMRVALPPSAAQVEVRMRVSADATSKLDPRPRSPFAPALLAAANPIGWTSAGVHNAKLIPAADSSIAGELSFVVPAPRAPALYLQVVNGGERAGRFDTLRIAFRH